VIISRQSSAGCQPEIDHGLRGAKAALTTTARPVEGGRPERRARHLGLAGLDLHDRCSSHGNSFAETDATDEATARQGTKFARWHSYRSDPPGRGKWRNSSAFLGLSASVRPSRGRICHRWWHRADRLTTAGPMTLTHESHLKSTSTLFVGLKKTRGPLGMSGLSGLPAATFHFVSAFSRALMTFMSISVVA